MTTLKEKLHDIHFPFDENHWKALEKRLDEKRKKRFLFLIIPAILLLLGFAIVMYLSSSTKHQSISGQIIQAGRGDSGRHTKVADTELRLSKDDTRDLHTKEKMRVARNKAPNRILAQAHPHSGTTKHEHAGYGRAIPEKQRMETGIFPAGDAGNFTGSLQDPPDDGNLTNESIPLTADTSYDPLTLDPLGLKKTKWQYVFKDTLLKQPALKLKSRYKHEWIAGRSLILKPNAPKVESFNAQAYHLAYRAYLSKHIFVGLGLSVEYYRYSVPDYRIVYRDVIGRNQFLAYNGASLKFTQLASAVSAGYKVNITPRIHATFEAGIQYLAVVSSRNDIRVSYTIEYKFYDTVARKEDVRKIKNDRGTQQAIGLNPLPAYQLTYFGKAGLGFDLWKKRAGLMTFVDYRHLPVLALADKPKNHLWMPGASLYFRF
jgi:hypothetical protein